MNNQDKIRHAVKLWIEQQNVVAQQLGISPAGLNKMLSGASALPLPRFLQLVVATHPSQNEVDQVFALYLEDLGLSPSSLRLIARDKGEEGDIRARIHAMVDQIPDAKLPVLAPLVEMMVAQHDDGDK